jgi:tetratricopeptide (TPR) repeat protein
MKRRQNRCVILAALFCFAAAKVPLQAQQKNPVLEAWDGQYYNAPTSAQTSSARDHVLQEIDAYLKAHASEEAAYRTSALGYNHVGENERALSVLKAFLQRFPTDTSNDSLVLFIFSNYGTGADFLAVPPHVQNQPDYWHMALQPLVRDHASATALEHAGVEDLKRVPPEQDKGGGERIDVAEIWLSHGIDPHLIEPVAREAVRISELGPEPDFIAIDTKQRSILDRLVIRSVNRSTLGWVLFKEGRYPEARKELEQAAKLAEDGLFATRDVYFRLGQTLEKLGEFKAALLAYDEEFAWGSAGPDVEAAQAALYKQIHGSSNGLNTDELNRINNLAMQRNKDATGVVSETNRDLGRFALLDEHGQALDLTQYRGKVVVIDFWATWCGQCLLTMKETSALQQRYPNQIVVIAPNQDPELSRAKARHYLDKMGYRFQLVYDDDKRRQIELPYIPARLVIDPKGRLRFMEFGASAPGNARLDMKVAELIKAVEQMPSPHTGG